ncbi:inositol hexakisphosphate and diphosphoinositol-pentakisphosphate kinase [Tilletia horrida]|nr:inositol hexakisphosphate and diphosphoinositol-pentakisphosphate kinase [Tilletia horrida]
MPSGSRWKPLFRSGSSSNNAHSGSGSTSASTSTSPSPLGQQLPITASLTDTRDDSAIDNSAAPSSAASSPPPTPTASTATTAPLPVVILGVAAMDRKARSKPMQNILNRLMANTEVDIQIVMFGDKTLIDEPPESWPICDVLISFFSSGFPIDKAIAYVDLRKPVCVNDLRCQKVLWDRRTVLAILDKCGVPTPRRIEVDRDTGPTFEREIMHDLKKRLGITFNPRATAHEVTLKDEDTIVVDGQEMKKPFVEKPVSGEDHNIHIYFSKKQGGGGRRLFRKVGNKSSEFDPELTEPRLEGSYIYEEFLAVDNAEDIKVYTIGPYFVHAETRKSPVVDGVVKRNPDGKEIRYITNLSKEEVKIATSISKAFKQNICGFDLLRVAGKSYVIDVNGWSFVKGNDYYYDRCAEILGKFCKSHVPTRSQLLPSSMSTSGSGLGLGTTIHHGPRPASSASNYRQFGSPSNFGGSASGSGTGTHGEKEPSSWQLKSNVTVFRHGDRTPKQKLKRSFKVKDPWTAPLIALLQGRREEIILRTGLELVSEAAAEATRLPGANKEDLEMVIEVINRKKTFEGTKVQIKPGFQKDKEDGELEKVQLIIKWGGEFSHAAKYQAKDYGNAMRRDMMIMNEAALRNTTVYTSSERRVTASADIFTAAFLADSAQSDEPLNMIIDRALLDDSNAAKDLMDKVKKKLKASLRPDAEVAAEKPDFWPEGMDAPAQLVQKTGQIIKVLSGFVKANYERLEVDKIQRKWCTHETPALFRERWEKLFKDFDDSPYDPSRISELYDMLSHDGLHNRPFLLAVFADPDAPSGKAHEKLHELYHHAHVLFSYVCPREYGITPQEKERIGLLTSLPLLQSITENLRAAQDSKGMCAFYFTKESHIHTLLNLILASDLPVIMERMPPLDYFSSITFEVYERSSPSGNNSTHATPSLNQSPSLALLNPVPVASDTASIGSEQTGMTFASSIRPPPERSLIISVSEGAHSSNILSMSLDARHALVPQRPRHLTTHIEYEEAMLKLEAHTKGEELLECDRRLIEGQTVFGGVPVPDRETMRVKPRSNSVGSSVRSSQGFGRGH